MHETRRHQSSSGHGTPSTVIWSGVRAYGATRTCVPRKTATPALTCRNPSPTTAHLDDFLVARGDEVVVAAGDRDVHMTPRGVLTPLRHIACFTDGCQRVMPCSRLSPGASLIAQH